MKIPPATTGRGNKRLNPAVLRKMLEDHSITEVGAFFGVSRQRIFQIAGPVNRPNGTRLRNPARHRKIAEGASEPAYTA